MLRSKLLLLALCLLSLTETNSSAATKNIAIAAKNVKVLPGFKVDIIASFPKDLASIVSLTVDHQGHLLAGSQNDKLFRIIPGDLNQIPCVSNIQQIPTPLGGAHGLLYAFEHLYVVKTDGDGERGVYRLKDTDKKGGFADPELIVPIPGKGEHGAHGLVAGPLGRWIYLIAGNGTGTPNDIQRDLPVTIKPTDSFSTPARQGWVIRFSPDGKNRELFCQGLRNSYDLAFNPNGDLFTFDSDNEGFMGLPWYRPTNVYHLISGADYGWRQSPANLMPYYPDTLPPTLEIGPGSPTGVIFGTRTHFPAKYQNAFYVCDWSYGRIYAVHLKQNDATYSGTWEFFASGTPLAVTDIVVGHDGALYFATGGRGNQSNIYRITHKVQTPFVVPPEISGLAHQRQRLSTLNRSPAIIDYRSLAPSLRSSDRTIRYAARTALEHQPLKLWSDYVFTESEKTALLEGLTALARQAPASFQELTYQKLTSLKWRGLSEDQRLASLRIFSILIERHGLPTETDHPKVLAYLNPLFPAELNNINKELALLLSKFQPDGFTQRTLDSITKAESLMTQFHFLSILMETGKYDFTEGQKEQLTQAINPYELRAVAFRKYRAQSEELQTLIRTLGLPEVEDSLPSLPIVQKWEFEELISLTNSDNLKAADIANGKAAFRKVRCDNCHRIGNSGGVLGPNLNGIAGRYSATTLLEHIVKPSIVISDQYQANIFVLNDGRKITGQIVNLSNGRYSIRTDPFRPFARTDIPATDIEEVIPSKTSLMPAGLLNPLTKNEVRDLLGYLLNPQ